MRPRAKPRDRVADEAALTPRRRRWVCLLLIVYLVGMHLRLSIYSSSGSIVLPMYLMLLSAGLLAFMFLGELSKRVGDLMLLLALFVLLQPMLAFAPDSGGMEGLRSGAQLVASIGSALVVIYAASKIEILLLRRIFLGFWSVLIAMAFLETAGLRPLFSQVRDLIYAGSGRGVYAEDRRDLVLYGTVRPSALASEPSYLADSYMCMIALVFLLDKDRGRPASWIRLALMVGIGFAVAPSAKIVFYLLALLCWQLWSQNTNARIILLTFTGAAIALYASYGSAVVGGIGQLRFSETGSFFGRILVGPQVALEALSRYPLLGYGVGNTEGLYPIVARAWQDSGAFARFPWYKGAGPTVLMSSGFWWMWLFLGVLGGIVFTLIAVRLLARIGVLQPMRAIVCAWIVWYAGAAFVDPMSWFVVAVFAIPAISRKGPDGDM